MDDFKISQKQLTEQQRERITQNFRAAKAIRDRKRSQLFNTPPSPSSIWPNHPGQGRLSLDGCTSESHFRSPPISRSRKKTHIEVSTHEMPRKALSELSSNAIYRLRKFQGSECVTSRGTPPKTEYCHKIGDGAIVQSRNIGSCPSIPEANAALTSIQSHQSITEVLNDDFDEMLFEEIDILCGQRRKAEDNVIHPKAESPLNRNISPEENSTTLVKTGSSTDVCKNVGSIRYPTAHKEDKILEFLAAIFQSKDDGKPEHGKSIPLSLPDDANSLESTSLATGGICPRFESSGLQPIPSKGVGKSGGMKVLDQEAGEINLLESAEMCGGIDPCQLNPPDPPESLNVNDAPLTLSSDTLNISGVLHGCTSVSESSILASEASISAESLKNQNSTDQRHGSKFSERETAMANSVKSTGGPELPAENIPFSVNTPLVRELGSSPEALVNQRVPSYLQNLNASQREAAASDTTKPLLILAGPGSGKTSTMVARLIHLLEEGIEPKCVLAMTFTTAAANEMRERVGAAIGKIASKELAISTFHSFCLQLCRTHADKLGRTPEFLVYGTGQQRKAVIEATRIAFSEHKGEQLPGLNGSKDLPDEKYESTNPSRWREQARKWQQFVTQAKCAGRTSTYYEKIGNMLGASVLRNYEKTLTACNALDYHDFISCAARLLEEHQSVLEECQRTWCCILVDEFQDTSAMQYNFLQLLASHQRITVVGDDDQSIFGFNGANAGGFSSFRKDFPTLKEATGKLFQSTFRSRKIPFNVHGVAFYRKKVIKTITALFWTVLPGRKDIFSRRVFKAMYGGEKSESKKAVEYVEKISRSKNCDFLQAASEIFTAKVSGTFTRRQLAMGRKVLSSINTVKHLVSKEQSLSAVITAVANLLPQRPIFDTRAVVTEDGRRLLNEDEDSRTVLEYLLDDVNEFLGKHYNSCPPKGVELEIGGCSSALRAFLGYMTAREEENFRNRKEENNNSVTLTTMHQSKGLEWDTVFIVKWQLNFELSYFGNKANDTETPLLHEGSGCVNEDSGSLEEERRLFYVAMTRAKKKLYISYIVVDSDRQILKPTRFLAELPRALLEFQDGASQIRPEITTPIKEQPAKIEHLSTDSLSNAQVDELSKVSGEEVQNNKDGPVVEHDKIDNDVARKDGSASNAPAVQSCLRTNAFLKGFSIEARSVVAGLFHTWAKKPSFQDPKRLLSKVGFVIDERLRSKGTRNKEVLINLKLALRDETALSYAQNVLAWEKLPAEERAVLQAERQEHFQIQNSERAQAAACATPKQEILNNDLIRNCCRDIVFAKPRLYG
ncbi:hypothetical protein AXG93_1420s1000 [Marchantia polymorpha subsp. ruderalis]|uniref:DNA 3'-5' helicase n=1 Tax=Marchantia polymorpha subsp. ruderalis TaxID=1480154 RepID=A0A176VWV2_MARPO|nr:hypothetical protein AXG93_1420s1000 [Marchantia polymorpha subsp. ruderalis]